MVNRSAISFAEGAAPDAEDAGASPEPDPDATARGALAIPCWLAEDLLL